MSISATNGNATQVNAGGHSFGKVKKALDDLQQAIKSGNLDDAKAAYSQLQASAPKGASADSPIGRKIAAIGKALDSGDLGAAQTALDDIKKAGPRRPDGPGSGSGPPGAPPPGGPPPAAGAHRGHGGGHADGDNDSDSSSRSSSSSTYEAADTNHDGKVTMQELIAYAQAQAAKSSSSSSSSSEGGSSTSKSNTGAGAIDTFA